MIAVTVWAAPSLADTDYKCLQSCMTGGKTAASCLPQCIVNPAPGNKPKFTTHVDYRCLDVCVSGGKQAATCLAQCTYEEAVPPSGLPLVKTEARPLSHKPLEAPVPAGNEILLPDRRKAVMSGNTIGNYECVNQCVQTGMQSEMCSQRCNVEATKQ